MSTSDRPAHLGDQATAEGRDGVASVTEEGQRAERTGGTGATSVGDRASELGLNREAVVERQKERYGGIKFGSAFFGWLTATGTAVLLTALVAPAGPAGRGGAGARAGAGRRPGAPKAPAPGGARGHAPPPLPLLAP